MDSAAQAKGEVRVRDILIRPTEKMGLLRPKGMTVKGFEEMKTELCQKLAYMSDLGLAALAEQLIENPAEKEKNRFQVAKIVCGWACDMEQPPADASPLIRKVFASPLGCDAIAGGWAPELLGRLRKTRLWPKNFIVGEIKRTAEGNLRRMQGIETMQSRGETLSDDDRDFMARRNAAMARCKEIANLATSGATA